MMTWMNTTRLFVDALLGQERGGRLAHLHLQGVCRASGPKTPAAVKWLRDRIRDALSMVSKLGDRVAVSFLKVGLLFIFSQSLMCLIPIALSRTTTRTSSWWRIVARTVMNCGPSSLCTACRRSARGAVPVQCILNAVNLPVPALQSYIEQAMKSRQAMANNYLTVRGMWLHRF
jgi:hypothetical protein